MKTKNFTATKSKINNLWHIRDRKDNFVAAYVPVDELLDVHNYIFGASELKEIIKLLEKIEDESN